MVMIRSSWDENDLMSKPIRIIVVSNHGVCSNTTVWFLRQNINQRANLETVVDDLETEKSLIVEMSDKKAE
jgi:hypothetical protein